MDVNLTKLRKDWRYIGLDDKDIAEIIGITPQHLSSKISGKEKTDLSATQLAVICQIVKKPMEDYIIGAVCERCFSTVDVRKLQDGTHLCESCMKGASDE